MSAVAAAAKAVEAVELQSYLVTKHSWKGKYKRILSIGSTGISTYNPEKFDQTNRWTYSDVLSAAPNKTGSVSEFCYLRRTKRINSLWSLPPLAP